MTITDVRYFRGYNAADTLTVNGNTVINDGILGSTGYTGAQTFGGTVTVNSGGEYRATDATNEFGGDVYVNDGGIFTVVGSENTVWFNDDFTTYGDTLWQDSVIRFNSTSDCSIFWNASGNANMTIVNSTVSNSGSGDNTYGAYIMSTPWVSGDIIIHDSYIEHASDDGCSNSAWDYFTINNGADVNNTTFYLSLIHI